MSETSLAPYQSEIEQWVAENKTNQEIAELLKRHGATEGTSERSIRRAKKRWGLVGQFEAPEPARLSINGDNAEVVDKPTTKDKTPEDLMTERGLKLDEWEIVSMTINEWDGPVKGGSKQPLKQLKIHLKRKVPLEILSPARTDGPLLLVRAKAAPKNGPRRVILCGDQQAPYHDLKLHQAVCEFIHAYDPHEGVLMGDTIDFPDISRHPNSPEKDATSQECLDSGYAVLKDYREANSAVAWKKLAGNHDERLRRFQIDKVERLYGLRRAKLPDEVAELPVLDVGHLMRLDELGIEYIRPKGDYEHEQINVSPHLAARHGWIARKGSGSSALQTLEHLGYSVVVGHTHRQALVHKTRHDINGETSTLAACETGCLCDIDGLGYTVAPDWQNGFATAEIWPDGTFNIDLATFVNGTLYHRDKRY